MLVRPHLSFACSAIRQLYQSVQRLNMSISSLKYDSYGNPSDILYYTSENQPEKLNDDQIELELLYAPINPSDINILQGKYPLRPPLPAVGGVEGVARVIRVGKNVSDVQPNDRVVPITAGFGTWRSGGVFNRKDWFKIPATIPDKLAATLLVNPTTAYAMLNNFVDLPPGSCIIQNGATSQVGQAIIRFAASRNISTINLVRDRDDWDETAEYLKQLGGTVVTTEEKVREACAEQKLPEPLLGLNCVGGASSMCVAKMLAHGGVMVTYGGMSMQPVQIPTGLMIFKDIKAHGFWLSGTKKQNIPELLGHMVTAVESNVLTEGQYTEFDLKDYKAAFQEAQRPKKLSKVLFKCN